MSRLSDSSDVPGSALGSDAEQVAVVSPRWHHSEASASGSELGRAASELARSDAEAAALDAPALEGGLEADLETEDALASSTPSAFLGLAPAAQPAPPPQSPPGSPPSSPQPLLTAARPSALFVFSSAGKPIWSSLGEAHAAAETLATAQALLAVVQGARAEALRGLTCGSLRLALLERPPLNLLAASLRGEPFPVLRRQLHTLHAQLVGLLTGPGLDSLFKRVPGYDLRRLLAGAEPRLASLCASFQRSPAASLGAARSLPLPAPQRAAAQRALGQALRSAGPAALHALLLAGPEAVAAAAGARQLTSSRLSALDAQVLLNTLAPVARWSGDESLVPLCLPEFDSRANVGAHVWSLGRGVRLALLLAGGGPSPEELKRVAEDCRRALAEQGGLAEMERAVDELRRLCPSSFGGGEGSDEGQARGERRRESGDTDGENRRDTGEENRRDAGGESRRDTGGENRRDQSGEHRRDTSGENRRDTSGEHRRDTSGENRRDTSGENRRDATASPGFSSVSSPGPDAHRAGPAPAAWLDLEQLPPSVGGGKPGETSLLYWVYKSTASESFVEACMAPVAIPMQQPGCRQPLLAPPPAQDIMIALAQIRAAMFDPGRGTDPSQASGPLQVMRFESRQGFCMLATLGQGSELYLVFDALTTHKECAAVCNALAAWLHARDDTWFF